MWFLLPLLGVGGLFAAIALTKKPAQAAPMAPTPAQTQAGLSTPELQLLADTSLRLIGKARKPEIAPQQSQVQQAIQIANSYKLPETAAALANGFQQWPQTDVWPGTKTSVTQFLTALWGQSQYRV